VESRVFAAFSARLGITNICEYEQKTLKKHQDLLQQQASVAKQLAALTAQLAYEQKRDFQGNLDRLTAQMTQATEEQEALLTLEQRLLAEEIQSRGKVNEAKAKVAAALQAREQLHAELRATQARRAEVLKDREALTKKLSAEEILIERGRTVLHEILQKARTDEVALPTVPQGEQGGDEGAAGTGAGAGRRSSKGAVASQRDSEDLRWEGSQSQSQAQKHRATGAEGTNICDVFRFDCVGHGERAFSISTLSM
jgi:hypothetical protein